MRVYLPATLSTVAQLRQQGSVAASLGYGVTPALRERYATGDQEELEYAAFSEATEASLMLLAAMPDQPPRRVVIAADAPADPAGPGDRRAGARVRLPGPVPVSAVAAVHVDGIDAQAEVAAAAAALRAAGPVDPDRPFDLRTHPDLELTLGAAADHELEWYDVSELARLR